MFHTLCKNSKVAEYYTIFTFNIMIITDSEVQLSSNS